MNTQRFAGILVMAALFAMASVCGALAVGEDKVVATVKDAPITAAALAAHMEATKLSRDEALNDLVEEKQLRLAAASNGIDVPAGSWSADERAAVEAAIFKARSLPVPPFVGELVVDHAFIQIPAEAEGQQAAMALIQKLRTMIEGGASFTEAYNRLGVDGSSWHVAEWEEYPITALPDEVRDTAPGGLSAIVATSDGYHLFRVHERKIPADEIRTAVRIYLLETTYDYVNIIEE